MRSRLASCCFAQAVEIGDVFDQAAVDQLIDEFFAQAFDVHGAAGAKEFQTLFELCRAGDADAAVSGFAFFPKDRRTAYRAVVRHDEAPLLAVALFRQDLHNVGNHVAGALDDDGVADADVFAFDFVHVVQRGALDRDAADGHRLQAGDRRQSAGAAHLGLDVENRVSSPGAA